MATNTTTITTLPQSTSSSSSASAAAAATSSILSDLTSSIAASVSSAILSRSTTTVPATTTADTTSTVRASSAPASTQLITSIVTQSSVAGQTSLPPVTVVVTSVVDPTTTAPTTTTSATTSSTSNPAALSTSAGSSSSGGGGLSPQGRTAVAVVVPVVAVALLVLAAIFFWRRRKQRKAAAEERRKEVEEYSFNPNNNPTLPAVAADGHSDMAEDHSGGYRGWGAAMSNRKASTTLSGGHTHGQPSDAGSNPGLSTSATAFGGSDGQNSDMFKNRDAMNSDDVAALGAAPVAANNRGDMRRGPSNASSSYSAGHRSDHSEPGSGHMGTSETYGSPQNYNTYGYTQAGPYGDGTYGGGSEMPVVRDVSARRNTQIEQGGRYQQGNSGIAQNF